ncbi:hypothetical protein DZF91_00325 [Actinomadura logoneensis]|uniref:DUF5753 domain-containing protein n=1 Tax=Actinomadura logoneensis TaxID=2293572 RepID=A0A372JU62_9ACTN|nr:hypothetical protein DZF91_00325 [Actinomadura logoneensis]
MRDLDAAHSLWDLIAVELDRQIYVQSTSKAGMARILGCTPGHVTRLLRGTRRLTPENAVKLDDAWELRGLLSHLVAHALARPEDAWLPSLAAYEKRALRIRTWDLGTISGLWQTSEYAAALFGQAYSAGLLKDVDKALTSRMERQTNVWGHDDPPRISAFISWMALESFVGSPEIMRGQFEHLLDLGGRPGVSIRVVGREPGWHIGHDGGCQLMTVGGGDVAFAEATGAVGNIFLAPRRVEHYARRLETMGDIAYDVSATRAVIEEVMNRCG